MSIEKVESFPIEAIAEREAREEHRSHVWENQSLARGIWLPEKVLYIAVNSGRSHSGMGTRDRISENVDPTADIALLCPESLIIDGLTESIGAFVSIGSPLSNISARILDGHAETLQRVRRPLLETSFITEFDVSNKSVVSYIEGEKVLEQDRRIVDERGNEIFHPNLINHVPQHDAVRLDS